MVRRLVRMVPAMLGLAMLFGCSAFPADQGKIIQVMLEHVTDQGILEKWSANVDGDVWEPGMSGQVCITTSVFMKGVRGHVDLGTQGGVTGLALGLREELLRQFADPRTPQDVRDKIIVLLGGTAGGNPSSAESGGGG